MSHPQDRLKCPTQRHSPDHAGDGYEDVPVNAIDMPVSLILATSSRSVTCEKSSCDTDVEGSEERVAEGLRMGVVECV